MLAGNGNGADGQHFTQVSKKQEHKCDHGTERHRNSSKNHQDKSLALSSERRAVPTQERKMTSKQK